MSRQGNRWDNAPTESGFNRFKNERVHVFATPPTHAQIKATAFEYIEVFDNRKRQHSTPGYQSPVQFLENRSRAFFVQVFTYHSLHRHSARSEAKSQNPDAAWIPRLRAE